MAHPEPLPSTARGGTVEVDVRTKGIVLEDADTDDRNPQVLGGQLDINRGNKQIAHGINRELRPVNL